MLKTLFKSISQTLKQHMFTIEKVREHQSYTNKKPQRQSSNPILFYSNIPKVSTDPGISQLVQ